MAKRIAKWIIRTCGSFPSQWEGELLPKNKDPGPYAVVEDFMYKFNSDDELLDKYGNSKNNFFYARYRHGNFDFRVGNSIEKAISSGVSIMSFSDGGGGEMSDEEMMNITARCISWEKVELVND